MFAAGLALGATAVVLGVVQRGEADALRARVAALQGSLAQHDRLAVDLGVAMSTRSEELHAALELVRVNQGAMKTWIQSPRQDETSARRALMRYKTAQTEGAGILVRYNKAWRRAQDAWFVYADGVTALSRRAGIDPPAITKPSESK